MSLDPRLTSLLLPTRGRPANVQRLLTSMVETAASPELLEVILYVDDDDETLDALKTVLCGFHGGIRTRLVVGPRPAVIEQCTHVCYLASRGGILGYLGDDVIFRTKGWDALVRAEFDATLDGILLVHGRDGHHDDKRAIHGFISRKWAETLGRVHYQGLTYADLWLTEVADALGRRRYLPDVYMEHLHPYFGKASVDETYAAKAPSATFFAEYARLAPERANDVRLLRAAMTREPSPVVESVEEGPTGRGSLLCVSMILKDEAHCIKSTIDSCKGFVDRWCILDTGSTDGTQALLRELLGARLELFEEPFVDFAASRNRALDLCGDASEYILMLSADEEVKGPGALRQFLSTRRHERGANDECYRTVIEFKGSTVYDSNRVMRSRARWRYVGVTHEVLMHPSGRNPCVPRVEGASIVHHPDTAPSLEDGERRSKARYERDVKLLSAEVDANPHDARSWFYLGLTHHWSGQPFQAIKALEKRVALGGEGWGEELYVARLTMARASCNLGLSWSHSLQLYLAAHAQSPHRAEALADVTGHYAHEEDHALTVLFGTMAFAIPFPTQDSLFIEKVVYDWVVADMLATHAYYLEGAEEVGLLAARHAVKGGPAEQMPRLLDNLRHSEERLVRSGKAAPVVGAKRALSSSHLAALRASWGGKPRP